MAKNSIRDYDATSGNNTDVQSVDISEGCAASGINNALREIMTDLKNVSTGAVALETPAADQLNVDNIRIDGNTISSTDTNGNVNIDPAGTGDTIIASGNVGIGGTPNDTLHVYGDIVIENTTNTPYIDFVESGDNTDSKARIKMDQVSGTAGELLFFTEGSGTLSERMRIGSDGRIYFNTTTNFVGQGNTSTGQMFQPEGTAYFSRASGYSLGLNRNGDGELTNFSRSGSFVGSINVTSSSTSYNTSSDYRLKEAVVDMTGAITRVKALAPKRFNFIVDDSVTVDGFLAHEAQTVVPEAVSGTHNEVDDDGNAVMQGIDQSKLVPLLTGALQEAIAKIETLETQRADLETRLTALENA